MTGGDASADLDFEAVFRANPSPCLVVDAQLNFTAVNDAYLQATLTTRERLLGRHIFDAFPDNPADPQANSTANLGASLERVLTRRERDVMAIQRYDIRIGDSETFEERYWSPVNTPIFDASGRIRQILHRVEDVTEFMQQESRVAAVKLHNDEQALEIRLANKRLREANIALERERELRELFVLALTHDLRTPLAAAKFAAHLLYEKGHDPVQGQRLSARIAASLDRAESMINDLLDANHLRSGGTLRIEVQPSELRELVADTLNELSTLYGDRFLLRAPASVPGQWSPPELRRMLENLCINAIKYGAPTTPVTVMIEDNTEGVVIRVHNLGKPIAKTEQAKLFEPYHRGENDAASRQGWGLGLTVAAGIAAAHGGSLTLESSAEEGTTFSVTLPRNTPARAE